MNRIRRLLFFHVLLSIGPALAWSDQDAIVFGRGVFRSGDEAWREDMPALRERLKNQLGITDEELDHRFTFDLATNKTTCGTQYSCFGDIFESAVQWAEQNTPEADDRKIWQLIWSLTPPASLADNFMGIVRSFQPLNITTADVSEQVSLYERLIGTVHRRVVLVAHSQGNYFGNFAYNELGVSSRVSFGMYSVATPAPDVLGRGEPYYTEFLDFIHLVPDSLPSNMNSGECSNPWTCHFFAVSYMEGISGAIIADEILALLESLEKPQVLPPDKLLLLDSFFDRLLVLDPATSQSRSLMLLTHDFLSGLAYDRSSGLFYSVDAATNELVEIDLQRSSERSVGVVGISTVQDLTFGPGGILYSVTNGAFSSSQLVRIDIQTGHGVPVGNITSDQFSGLVYDPESTMMYATRSFANGLFEVSPSSGTFTMFNSNLGPGALYLANIPGSAAIFAVGNSRSANASLVSRVDPAAPVFSLIAGFNPVRSITGIEMVSLQGVQVPPNQPAVIGLLHPGSQNLVADLSMTILWLDDDADDDARVSLWYATDSSCANPVRIVSGLSEDDEHDQYVWNTSSVPEGQYYILATITDEVNQVVSDCSQWSATIDHP